jgi:hypothetical protein
MIFKTLLRYYYAGHAPEMPHWFTIDYKMEYNKIFHAPFPHGGCSHTSHTNHCDKCRKWDDDQETYDKNRSANEMHREIKTYFAWRWFYADAMIKSKESKDDR